ncbi:PREDICTED: putative B3 domain-containing protein At3g24850 [Nicotiana attenuata]|uniref:B3 domain-containing protein n=1 Tax=Nicotiana attenuata TaxID=49451 RepID=A0A314LIC4_NICAT|nr:PREDICTED: putative B3 domain-containing protein At3g24850 [Nicotiana attenuata]OIT40334.1 b3 domain-containing protein [Nicotiana attenuata]
MLTVDDFLDMEFKPNMSRMDYLLAVAEVAQLKSMYEEEDNVVAEQDKDYCIKKEEKIIHNIQSIVSSFPVNNQDNHALDIDIPKGRRSLQNVRPRKVTEQFICSEELMIKKAVENSKEKEIRVVKAGDGENRVIKINWAVGKSRAEKADYDPLGLSNEEYFKPEKQEEEDKEEDKREKKKVKRNIIVRVAPPVVINDQPRELPIEFKNKITEIGGSVESAILVIEKRLFETDIKPGEGRLSIPQRQMSNEFLKPEEDAYLNTRNGNNVSEKKVKLIEPCLETCDINLRKWNMNKSNGKTSSSYVLTTYWNAVTKRNALKIATLVQLWAFRKGSELCFALVKL